MTAKEAVENFLVALDGLSKPPFEPEEIPEVTIAASDLILVCLNETNGVEDVIKELRKQANLLDVIDKAVKLNPILELLDGPAIGLGFDALAYFLQGLVDNLKK